MTRSTLGGGFSGLLGLNKVRLNPEQMTSLGRPAADPAPAAQSVSDRMDTAQAASANVPAAGSGIDPALRDKMAAYNEKQRLAEEARRPGIRPVVSGYRHGSGPPPLSKTSYKNPGMKVANIR